ncbi:APC family permease [Pseudonocardia sp. KRD291]|uniref:APC family permease n=1 Tax=Pseudonocardia sp. KRD291 TaxID=2792007 RepID=UPI001C49F9D1|nr:APC family permease [Pseudonocardia sp. KRD291]MBW0106249.1 APC family permease [Pseudonocardia sp. KRD291]
MRHPPSLRDRSPVHGLERRRLGVLDVFAQSVSGAAPSAAMAATPVIVAASAGGATIWSFAVATVLALLVAACIGRFTRRMAAPGGLYSLTAQGLGPGAAFACGMASLLGYGLLCAAAVAGAATYLTVLLGGGRWVTVAAALLIGIVVAGLALRGVRVAARVVLLVETVAITVLVVVFALLLAGGSLPGTGETTAAPVPGPAGIAAGVLPAVAAFIGFEIATSLGAEARRPFRTVPRAVGATAAVAGVLYLFAAHTQVVGFAATPGGLAGQSEPVLVLAGARGWSWIPTVLDLGLSMSFFACAAATANALARVLFSLARDGVAPQALGRTHARFRTPHVAVSVSVPVAVGVFAVPVALGVPAWSVLVALLTLATSGFLVAYLLVCVAAPVFLRRIGELTWPAVATTAVIAPALIAVLVAFVSGTPRAATVLGATALASLGWYGWLRLRRRDTLDAIGVYDETVADDVHGRAA